MSNKQLTAKVRLDVTQAEKKLKLLEKRINKVNNMVNKQSVATRGLSAGFNQAANSANKLNTNVKKSANSVGLLTKKVKLLAKAYLGVMGAQAVINTSDMITSAKNKLNNLPNGSQQSTQQTMDKTYAAAQRSRGDYGTMLTNVSKTMTLAGDAFQNNVDNAIKFQEIMSKAYTVGGASAAEQSSSMYQLVQALGSGVLQGDELRSVREGASYAYKEIEKFAQAIYGAEENLKDLASEGKITSDLVVAAILSAEEKINKAFENTDMTFAQAWTNIKNTAIKAFEPVLTKLNQALNSSAGQAIVSGITKTIIITANAVNWLFTLIEKVYNFIAVVLIPKLLLKLWILLQEIILWAMVKGAAVGAALSTAAAWMIANWQLALVLIILAAIVIAIIWVADSFVDACGIIVGWVYVVGAVIYNVIAFIMNMVFGMVNVIVMAMSDIGTVINNTWQSAKASFWEWVSECLNGTSLIAKAVSKIAELFGLDAVSIDAKINSAKSKMNDYHSDEEYMAGFSTFEYKNLKDSYSKGYEIGSNWGQGVTDKFDELKNKLGLNNDLFNPNSSTYDVGGSYDPEKALNGIKDNTGKIADSMDLTQEDMEYLRRVADMEWKKEFTTATIQVDMSNYNSINGMDDLDGIATRLADKLYEEMDAVANGVYA